MHIFYSKSVVEGINYLSLEEATHCIFVLRHGLGDSITVYDGNGGVFTGSIVEANKKTCGFKVTAQTTTDRKLPYVHLAIAPTKNMDRMEWLVEKIQEVGVDELSFVITQNSERRMLKTDRIQKKAIAAMKQSRYPFLIRINEALSLPQFYPSVLEGDKYIAHLKKDTVYLKDLSIDGKVVILVGPEGDFTTEEIEEASQYGFRGLSLGTNTYRTETAGLLASCYLKL